MPPSQPAHPAGALAHLPALDGVRGLAVLLVLSHHLRSLTEASGPIQFIWVRQSDSGWIGVELFFVLSGFLITRILLATREAPNYYSSFYGRRFLRIFPLYYTVLITWLIIQPRLFPGGAIKPLDALALLLFLSNWVHPFSLRGGGIAHFWTLAVEEQFYLLWPMCVRRLSPRGVLRTSAIVIVGVLIVRCGMRWNNWSPEAIYQFTICRADGLAMGAAIAAISMMPALAERLTRLPLATIGAATFIFGAAISRGYAQHGLVSQTIGYSLLGLSCALWVASLVLPGKRADARSLMSHPWLRTVGKYSYALYILHVPVKMLFDLALTQAGYGTLQTTNAFTDIALATTAGAITFGLAALSYRFLESPALRVKGRFEATHSSNA